MPEEGARFQIGLPMRFRIAGERFWRDGWADTMSLTEIVFRGEDGVEIGKTIDIRLVLRRPSSRERGGTIVSKAKVTRSLPLPEMPGYTAMTAELNSPRLLRFNPENGRV